MKTVFVKPGWYIDTVVKALPLDQKECDTVIFRQDVPSTYGFINVKLWVHLYVAEWAHNKKEAFIMVTKEEANADNGELLKLDDYEFDVEKRIEEILTIKLNNNCSPTPKK